MLSTLTARLLFTLHASSALLPQTGARGSSRSLRVGGACRHTCVRACDPEETRDSSSSIGLQRADGSLVDDLRQDFSSKLSQMQREVEMGVSSDFDSDFCWQVANVACARNRPAGLASPPVPQI